MIFEIAIRIVFKHLKIVKERLVSKFIGEWRTNSSLSVGRKGGEPRFPRKTLSGKSIRIRRDIGQASRHSMMDERNQTFRTDSNNDNIQIDVR